MTYAQALKASRLSGIAHCSDAELMTSFCEGDIQILCGAVFPHGSYRVWELDRGAG